MLPIKLNVCFVSKFVSEKETLFYPVIQPPCKKSKKLISNSLINVRTLHYMVYRNLLRCILMLLFYTVTRTTKCRSLN